MTFISKILDWRVRTCRNCGSWLDVRTFFCGPCYHQLIKQFTVQNEFMAQGFKVKSLFHWIPGDSDVLSHLILQMKRETPSAWKIWAEEFTQLHEQKNEASVFVTSKSASGKKHGENWALALSSVLHFPVLTSLQLKNIKSSQRRLNKMARLEREFIRPVDFSNMEPVLRENRVIFIDDVVTTGQTALAAYKALDCPSNFEVWCLVYRDTEGAHCRK